MANIQINITENGTTTLATSGCICDRNIDINVDVAGSGGGGFEPTDADLTYGGICNYLFANDRNKWVIDQYGNRITTTEIKDANYMFENYTGETIPFEINFEPYNSTSINESMFNACKNLKELPVINNLRIGAFSSNFINNCWNLKKITIDKFPNIDFSYYKSYAYGQQGNLFGYCHSLREIDKELLDEFMSLEQRVSPSYSYWFYSCYVLDELKDLYVITEKELTNNMFSGFAQNCYRLKTFTFETDNDTPKVAKWKGQTIDLSKYIGYMTSQSHHYSTGYNSGITVDKQVTDDTTYQALKNDPDWFTGYIIYSRYNHDSALETIKSLPDTSAYLAEKGGQNIIKFNGSSGQNTDGGAINTLTEDEIAIATAKGWTVQIV